MLYVLDTNVLITARDQYYDFNIVPEFWDWLLYQATCKQVGLPTEVIEEVLDGSDQKGKDKLYAWTRDKANRTALEMGAANYEAVQHVLTVGYSATLTSEQIESRGADPFVVAHALVEKAARCVVSNEVSKPRKEPHNRPIPDAAALVGVRCISTFEFVRELQFCTMWRMLL